MRYKIFILIYLTLVSSISFGDSQQRYQHWLRAGNTWYERWMHVADEAGSMDAIGRMENLAPMLEMARNESLKDEKKEVYDRIQKIIVDTPGHAKYYQKQIQDAKNLFEETPGIEKGILFDIYLTTRSKAFAILEQLPSPETVEVLGELLSDKEIALNPAVIKKDISDLDGSPNCQSAGRAISKLIANPPVPEGRYPHGAESLWDHWYAQVKEGRRTYRFKADPQEYDLNGPVREARNPDIARVTKRPGVSDNSEINRSASSSSYFPLWFATGLLLLSGLLYYFFKRRSSAI